MGVIMENITNTISVVIPVYGCKEAIVPLTQELIDTFSNTMNIDYEIILVNDQCPQNSWEVIAQIAAENNKIKGINLARNYGQMAAILAGLEHSRGDYIVVMDCDLQDRPQDIVTMYSHLIENNHDVVFGRRINRQDYKMKKLLSRAFYKVYDYFADSQSDSTISNFSVSKRIVIDNYLRLREHSRAYTMYIKWMGFDIGYVDITHQERYAGESGYSLKKRIKLAVNHITSQSIKPLKISIGAGIISSAYAIIYAIILIIRKLFFQIDVAGWTSLMVSLYLIGGLILISIGILGIYIGNIFEEVKDRPIYIVKEILNKD